MREGKMKNKDFFSSLFWMSMGIAICYGGYDLGLGAAHAPGSGYIFFWLGIIMMGLSLAVLVQSVRLGPKVGEMKAIWSMIRWPHVSVTLSLVIYGYLFYYLGFVLSSFLLLLFLFKAVEPQKWSVAILGAILTALVAYLVFQVWLGTTLPAGLLEGLGEKIWSF
jgi:putative tricarboxylic transport membrane protein